MHTVSLPQYFLQHNHNGMTFHQFSLIQITPPMVLRSCLLTVLNNVAHEKENPFNCEADKLLTQCAKEASLTWCKTLFSFIYYSPNEVIYSKSKVTPSQDGGAGKFILIHVMCGEDIGVIFSAWRVCRDYNFEIQQ